jgi:integrase
MTKRDQTGDDNDEPSIITDSLCERVGDDCNQVDETYLTSYNWMLEKGEDQVKEDGLSENTAGNYIDRLDQLHREAIKLFGFDGQIIGPDQAEELLLLLARDTITKQDGESYSDTSKRKFANALQKHLQWQYYEEDLDYEWKPKIKFSDKNHTQAAEFTYEELVHLSKKAKSYGKLPSYYETPPEERDEPKGLVAQRLGKPKENINRDDWRRANQSVKYSSLISVGYDAGLTPKEVGKAKIGWYKPERQVLEIPSEAASKERIKEIISLSDESAEAMSKWIQERRHLEKYDGTNALWLNREGNPYASGSLSRIICKLCEKADIPDKDRPIRWYSLRHTLGRHMKSDGSLSQTNDQLRHDTFETTETTYGNSAAEER